jgi:hypothetical protein
MQVHHGPVRPSGNTHKPSQSTPIVLAPREPDPPFFSITSSMTPGHGLVSVHSHEVIQQLWPYGCRRAGAVQPPDLRPHSGPGPLVGPACYAGMGEGRKGGTAVGEEKGRSYTCRSWARTCGQRCVSARVRQGRLCAKGHADGRHFVVARARGVGRRNTVVLA